MTPAEMAMLLRHSSGMPLTEEMIRQDIADGAPTNVDGTMNLVHYTAWLLREQSRYEDEHAD